MAPEIDQFKQPGLIPLRRKDQLILLSIISQFKIYILKGRFQYIPTLRDQRFLHVFLISPVHKPSQMLLPLLKHSPRLQRAQTKILLKKGQRQPSPAVIDHLLRIRIPRSGLQRLFEIIKRTPLLIQIIICICQTKIPVVITRKVRLMRL